MYLEKAIFINRAPFERLELDFAKNGINVLTAINGRGKTTILSHIVDAFHEMARDPFSNTFEGKENKYYRISSGVFHVDNSMYSLVYFRFINDDNITDYIDCNGTITKEEYDNDITLNDKISYDRILSFLNNRKLAKFHTFQKENDVIEAFNHNILTYFPSYRFEMPGYLNEPYMTNVHFCTETTFERTLPNPIEIVSDLKSITNWIMDFVLDLYVNNHQDKESYLLRAINKILQETLSSKKHEGIVRFGIGKRNNGAQRISIEHIGVSPSPMIPHPQKTIIPSIYNLSAGEASLLCLFGELLRQGDKLSQSNRQIEMQNFKGIVLIDEVDKHLHITLQKETLPKLFALYPNIQFIVSSHSPFLNMGLAESLHERTQIIDLDNNGHTYVPEENDEYLKVYRMMVSENTRYAEAYSKLRDTLKRNHRPLVITEGKTDIKHILEAKKHLNIIDIEFDTLSEEQQPQGDSNLLTLLQQHAKVHDGRIIIGIFDCDKDDIIKKIAPEKQSFKSYGNNVFAFCIQPPPSRIEAEQRNISIEYLYSNEEIQTILRTGRRLFFGSEFTAKGKQIGGELFLTMPTGRAEDKVVESLKGQSVERIGNDFNYLATKDDFAKAVKDGEVHISESSWQNFQHIFDTIREIINLHSQVNTQSAAPII